MVGVLLELVLQIVIEVVLTGAWGVVKYGLSRVFGTEVM